MAKVSSVVCWALWDVYNEHLLKYFTVFLPQHEVYGYQRCL